MSRKTKPRPPVENAVKPPENVEETPAEKPSEEAEFHPHKHGHVAISPPETEVKHLDPGAITFS